MLDNILHQPQDDKFRVIRSANPHFHTKVASRKGGMEFLQACGFRQPTPQSQVGATITLGMLGVSGIAGDGYDATTWILPRNETDTAGSQENQEEVEETKLREQQQQQHQQQQHLITARRLLQKVALQDLGMKEEELPVYRLPPMVWGTSQRNTTGSSTTTFSQVEPFNVYRGHRFDAQAVVTGQTMGPPPNTNYVSPTEIELLKLQQRQKELERKLQHPVLDPEWRAYAANQSVTAGPVESTSTLASTTTPTTGAATGDASLLAEKLKLQQEKQLKQQNFTTKAMRDLEKIKKQKVYAHATLTIHFPDGCKVLGKFIPATTLKAVKDSIQSQVFTQGISQLFDLYITPPRRILSDDKTLQQEGLVPAAKIFISWKGSPPPLSAESTSHIRSDLFHSSTTPSSMTEIFPPSQPIAMMAADDSSTTNNATDSQNDKKKSGTSESREDALLRRMLGGKGTGLLSGKGTEANAAAATNTDSTSSSSSGKKLKWFKS